MIEQLPEDLLAPTQIPDKIRELVDAVNRLTELAKLSLGAPVGDPPKRYSVQPPHPTQGEVQRSENDLTWPMDPASPQRGIVRRPKEKGE